MIVVADSLVPRKLCGEHLSIFLVITGRELTLSVFVYTENCLYESHMMM